MFEIGIPEAKPIAYADIRNASGVLGYAEPLLGPQIATKQEVPVVGAGASAVDTSIVAGAWELPATMQLAQLSETLRARGVITRARDYSDGQIWIADYQMPGQALVRLLMINGTHSAFGTNATAEVRPGPHIYLIAYLAPKPQ